MVFGHKEGVVEPGSWEVVIGKDDLVDRAMGLPGPKAGFVAIEEGSGVFAVGEMEEGVGGGKDFNTAGEAMEFSKPRH